MSKFPKDKHTLTEGLEDGLDRRGFLRLAGASMLGVAASPMIARSAAAASVSGSAKAGGYPTRPINLICPYGAGGGSDQLDRTVSAYAKKTLGVPMPVQNVPGGGGAIGLAKLAGSPPDGYTIASLIADNVCSLAFAKQPWNMDQVTGICRLMNVPSFYFSNAKGKFKTIQEVIAAAKAKPGAIRVGTDGRNSVDELTSLIVGMKAGVKFRLVPFSKPAERYTSLLNGEVDILYEQAGDVARYIESGQFRPLVIFSKTKLDQLPKVPTSESLGWPVYFSQYRGIVAPAGTPSAIQKTLFGALQE
ncbi:MAG: Bug family tripartite tricarboxylate transporter substrate binding protein, partial [Terriglobia bacterium]